MIERREEEKKRRGKSTKQQDKEGDEIEVKIESIAKTVQDIQGRQLFFTFIRSWSLPMETDDLGRRSKARHKGTKRAARIVPPRCLARKEQTVLDRRGESISVSGHGRVRVRPAAPLVL